MDVDALWTWGSANTVIVGIKYLLDATPLQFRLSEYVSRLCVIPLSVQKPSGISFFFLKKGKKNDTNFTEIIQLTVIVLLAWQSQQQKQSVTTLLPKLA